MIPENHTLAEIVTKYPAAASLFEKFDLDYCCQGKRTLKEACPDEAVAGKIEHALHRIIEDAAASEETVAYDRFSPPDLIDHILNRHHAYVKAAMPRIAALLQKVSLRHGSGHPELLKIASLFAELRAELEQHMMKEEMVLFPRIRALFDTERNIPIRDLEAPVSMMRHEHDRAGILMHDIKALASDYELPQSACTSYRVCYEELKQFEHDLHRHVHLENNILFPKALKLAEQASAALN